MLSLQAMSIRSLAMFLWLFLLLGTPTHPQNLASFSIYDYLTDCCNSDCGRHYSLPRVRATLALRSALRCRGAAGTGRGLNAPGSIRRGGCELCRPRASPGNHAPAHSLADSSGSSPRPWERSSTRARAGGLSLYLAGLSDLVCGLYLYHDGPRTCVTKS